PTGRPNAPVIGQILSPDLRIVDADGANPRALVPHDAPGAILETPAWSPDGRGLYYSYYRPTYNGEQLVGETLEIRRHDMAGGDVTVVKNGSSPSVSRDGVQLVYVGEDVAAGQSLRVRALAT